MRRTLPVPTDTAAEGSASMPHPSQNLLSMQHRRALRCVRPVTVVTEVAFGVDATGDDAVTRSETVSAARGRCHPLEDGVSGSMTALVARNQGQRLDDSVT